MFITKKPGSLEADVVRVDVIAAAHARGEASLEDGKIGGDGIPPEVHVIAE